MDIENIKALRDLMECLGFPSTLDKKIVYYACLRQKEFSIKEQKAFGNDVMSYQIFFKESAGSGKPVCTHYDAFLRMNVQVESLTTNRPDLQRLDERMKGVNWEALSQFTMAPKFNLSDPATWQEQAEVEEIMLALESLASSSDGKMIADGLKYKHWIGLSLESMIPNLYLLKSKFEFSQRFYIIGNEGITADEAFRFLNNRWMQRKMQMEKKSDSEMEKKEELIKKPLKNKKAKNEGTKAIRTVVLSRETGK